jgi:hypothetical protein
MSQCTHERFISTEGGFLGPDAETRVSQFLFEFRFGL